jgi:hypothetical protein
MFKRNRNEVMSAEHLFSFNNVPEDKSEYYGMPIHQLSSRIKEDPKRFYKI